jgi:pyruvate dehydrogenase E2 component (dihydrolipoamide acetyltransferase)
VSAEEPRIQTVTMPKWGLSMKSGKVMAWLVEEGEEISPGMDLADIETDKIAGTLESAQQGVLRRIVAATGTDVPVSGVIAVVAAAEVPDDEIDAVVAKAQEDLAAGIVEEEAGPVQATVEANGRAISYATLGEGEEVVVLVHGYGGDKNSWLFITEPLAAGPDAAGGRAVHALDLPGHGASSKDVGDGSLDLLVATVLGFLDALDIPAAHLGGHSLGGAVVSAVALQAPSRVRSLTLMAPAGFSTGIDADYVRGFAEASSRRELKPMLARLFASEDLVTRQLVDDVLKYKRLDGVDAALRALQGTLLTDGGAGSSQALDLAGRLAELDVPVTVVWGAADRVIPPPGAPPGPWPLRVVDGAGHMVHMESPHAVLEVIEGVIAQTR